MIAFGKPVPTFPDHACAAGEAGIGRQWREDIGT
jgi:hypothetical protein